MGRVARGRDLDVAHSGTLLAIGSAEVWVLGADADCGYMGIWVGRACG